MNRAAPAALLLGLLSSPAAAVAVGIGGEIRNPAALTQVGAGDVRILLTNLSEGWLLGAGAVSGTRFNVAIPESFQPPVRPIDICPGVKVSPAGARTYTAETLLAYHAASGRLATVLQADHPTTPTRRGQWMYSDRTVTLKGRCAGLNTYYNLTLRQGWTGVMTVSKDGRFEVTNAAARLPYWVQPVITRAAKATFPALFSGQRSALSTR
ncbi:hypothetical protein [Deinococcus multiflagellatus]|uniref:Uncharacterized protein n=1 Tax=Deinococcus multiflagellatus TaxID=1656887 RepID=A0ABW1ZHS7_9DEIO|nr:hypothetical protein [Deinococcus multiflagellatus]MBZ9713103.1 hypothetical protein [Deinococcus multiflagellatus]